MQLQIMHKNLKVITLETQMAEDQMVLNNKQARTQDGTSAAAAGGETMALRSRIESLQTQLDQERRDRESLQTELASLYEKRAADKAELCQNSYNEELFQQTLDQIVDACMKQKQARKTAQAVANMWLGLVRGKHSQTVDQSPKQPVSAQSVTQNLVSRAQSMTQNLVSREEELHQAKQEITHAKALQRAAIEEFDGELMVMQRKLAEKQEELKQAKQEIAKTKALQEAVVEEFDGEVTTMQSRIKDLQLQLDKVTLNSQNDIKDLKQELDRERAARDIMKNEVLQRELLIMRLNGAVEADIMDMREQLLQNKGATIGTKQRDAESLTYPSSMDAASLQDVLGAPRIDVGILPCEVLGLHNASCCSPKAQPGATLTKHCVL